jgi:Uncharacterised nucleotidyltransferase
MTRRLLLAALSPDPAALAALGSSAAERVDWEWLLERARAHKVAALLAARLAEQAWAAALPESARDALDEIRRQGEERAARAQRTLREVARALTSRAVPFLVL